MLLYAKRFFVFILFKSQSTIIGSPDNRSPIIKVGRLAGGPAKTERFGWYGDVGLSSSCLPLQVGGPVRSIGLRVHTDLCQHNPKRLGGRRSRGSDGLGVPFPQGPTRRKTQGKRSCL